MMYWDKLCEWAWFTRNRMICRWEASERPLFVRTVWVKGIRHAILTREELSKKSRGSSAKSEPARNVDPEFTDRVCKWLRGRAITPYRGALWETPRQHSLDLKSSRAPLSRKTPGPGIRCSPILPRSPSPLPPSPPLSPPMVMEYRRPPPASAPPAVSSVRPKLHIFMPDTRNPPEDESREESLTFQALVDSFSQDKQLQCWTWKNNNFI